MFKKILSLDQALNLTGFAIYVNKELILHGCLSLKDIKENTPVCEKISNVKLFLQKIINDYEIDLVVIEDIQSQVNINTFKNLAWLQGVLINFLYENKISYLILKPSEWRAVVKIKGRKRIEQKQNAVDEVLKLHSKKVTEDEADAILIGLASLNAMDKFNEKIVKDFL